MEAWGGEGEVDEGDQVGYGAQVSALGAFLGAHKSL